MCVGTSGAHAEAGITSNFESTPYGKIPIQSQASYGNIFLIMCNILI